MRYKRRYISNKGVLIHRVRKESNTMDVEECSETGGKYVDGVCSWIEETEHNILFDYARVRKELVNEYGVATRTSDIRIKTDTVAPYQEEDILLIEGDRYSITVVEETTQNNKGNRRTTLTRKEYDIEAS